MTDVRLQVNDGAGVAQYLNNRFVTDGNGQQAMQPYVYAPDSNAILTTITTNQTTELATLASLLTALASVPVTGTFFQATQPVSIAASIPLPTGAATSANQATQITSLANLDVALSTRLKPADTLTAVTTVGTITNPVAVTGTFWQTTQPVSATNLDVALSTRLKPADTLAGVTTVTTVTTVSAVTGITNALPAGTNLLGKVGIDQTTPGTTNNVASNAVMTENAAGNLVAAATSIAASATGSNIVVDARAKRAVQIQVDVLTGGSAQAAGTYTIKWYREFGAGPTIDNVAVNSLQVTMGTAATHYIASIELPTGHWVVTVTNGDTANAITYAMTSSTVDN